MSEMGRLQYFLTVDDVSRHRSALAAMAVGFAVGLAMQVLGKPFKFSAYVAIAANAAMFTIGIWRYCRSTPKKVVRPAPIPIRRTIVRGLLAAAAIGVLSVVPIQRVEAGVLDRRL